MCIVLGGEKESSISYTKLLDIFCPDALYVEYIILGFVLINQT